MTGLRYVAAALAGAMVLAGQGSAAPAPGHASAKILDAAGKQVGNADVRADAKGLSITVKVKGLPPGPHGVHVHAIGQCAAPDFTSAGGHWNPTHKQHGMENPMGPHAGDLPNLEVGADGTGQVEFHVAGGQMSDLLDSDGAAIVVHAGKDDLMTDPSGNSGGRIACGVFAAK